MTTRCIALLSGGLDSMLAIRLMQEQDIEVEAVNFKTIFTCCQDHSGWAARQLGVRLTVVTQEDDYIDIIRRPKFGYGKGANPCIDCRIYMFQRAKQLMEQLGASFVVSGEVIGQRPKSQKKRDLGVIAHHSELEDVLLRPLSAKLLPPTKPERDGLVDRSKLHDFVGRGRKGLIKLAKQFGFSRIPGPSTGCQLTEVRFGKKVHDLVRKDPDSRRWDFELLRTGRHFRLSANTKIIVGRNQADNETLAYMHHLPEASRSTLLHPVGFPGPHVLIVGGQSEHELRMATGLMLRYAGRDQGERDQGEHRIQVHRGGQSWFTEGTPVPAATAMRSIAV